MNNEQIKKLIQQFPNDSDLGKAVRNLLTPKENFKNDSYEILSIINLSTNRIINDYTLYINHILNKSIWFKIHSVKRNSDNEIFTLNDKTNKGIIKEFSICEKENRIIVSFRNNTPCYLDCKGSELKKSAKLGTTEDGFEFYEGDSIILVNLTNLNYITIICNKYNIVPALNSKYLFFSKLENAKKYIESNTKKYSLNDIKKLNFDTFLNIKNYEF